MIRMHEDFNETTDLYLQLLRKAQEVEDPRLVGMILERLKEGAPHLLTAETGCVVIPFPMAAVRPSVRIPEPRFWPRVAAAQIGYIVAIYVLLLVGHSYFS
jgi:hypothetical protein